MTTIIFGIFEEGLVYAIMALGVYITYKILDFPDLSVDGTFPLGAALTAAGIANGGFHSSGLRPFRPLPFSWGGHGRLCHRTHPCQVKGTGPAVGIIVMTALYSINLRVRGKANLPIFSQGHDFQQPMAFRTIPQALKPFIQ